MNTAKNLIILFLLTFFSVHSFAATGNELGKTRNVKNFSGIKVSSGIELYITMGNRETLKIEADEEDIEDVKTEVKNGTLHIYMKRRNNWFNWGFNKTAKVYVTVKNLERIEASSGSDVESENVLEGDQLEVKTSSGSDIKLDVYYKTLSLHSGSGSDARISGKVKTFIAEASSGSDIKARELKTTISKLKASSGSDINVTVTDEVYAKASSGGDIKYYGNPQIKDTDSSSGGDVHQR
ncbi:MAG: head GIN domain-containing protein [Prolixibacteraceae bacterium]